MALHVLDVISADFQKSNLLAFVRNGGRGVFLGLFAGQRPAGKRLLNDIGLGFLVAQPLAVFIGQGF
jgi:hypothetical protein